MKRIVLFINSLSSGGAEHQLCELANGLAEKGYDVTIATFGDMDDHYTYNANVKRNRIAPQKSNGVKMLAIWKYFLTIKTDWVIAFGQRESKFCLLPLLLRSKRKVHAIAGERSSGVGMPTRQEKLMMNYLYHRADYIVPNSHAQRNYIINRKPEFESKTIAITNYTDLSKYVSTKLPNGEKIRIGVFGRYSKPKNCFRFVEAILFLKNRISNPFEIEWYGNQQNKDGLPNQYYVEMRDKVEKYGLREYLRLNNHIKDVMSVMPTFDAICLPSLWEGFSNSIGEAICCGKPCIVSDVGDNGVMVEDGVNGFLFDPTNIDSMVEAFVRFFSLSSTERQRMGEASRNKAHELFNRENFIGAYEKLINSK